MIRTRFAPSPTGELHIGGARSALFVYLFAKSKGGEFLLRIDDTDRERYVEGSTQRIIESLCWLDIVPDNINNIVIQSERTAIYKKYALELLEKQHAYICICDKETLEKDRKEQEANHLPPMYVGRCRDLNIQIKDVKEGEYIIRMKMPKEGIIKFNDLIRGDVQFNSALIDDQVLIKSDGFPTYHLATVVDEHEMKITHVIRAEEWLPSTPKHLVLFNMFGWTPPVFAHLPQVLAPDKSKLSKRHGATSVIEYMQLGYVKEALLNFLVLLGWHPKDDREIFSKEDLIKEFDLSRLQKGGAIFDIKKLNWINKKYISDILSTEEIVIRGQKFMQENRELTKNIVNAVKSRIEKLSDLKEISNVFFELPEYNIDLLIPPARNKESITLSHINVKNNLEELLSLILSIDESEFNKNNLESIILAIILEGKKGDYLWPLRVTLSGTKESPGPFEIMEALGKEKSITRINQGINKI